MIFFYNGETQKMGKRLKFSTKIDKIELYWRTYHIMFMFLISWMAREVGQTLIFGPSFWFWNHYEVLNGER